MAELLRYDCQEQAGTILVEQIGAHHVTWVKDLSLATVPGPGGQLLNAISVLSDEEATLNVANLIGGLVHTVGFFFRWNGVLVKDTDWEAFGPDADMRGGFDTSNKTDNTHGLYGGESIGANGSADPMLDGNWHFVHFQHTNNDVGWYIDNVYIDNEAIAAATPTDGIVTIGTSDGGGFEICGLTYWDSQPDIDAIRERLYPVATVDPEISGAPYAGENLFAIGKGTWSDGTFLGQNWQADGEDITGATGDVLKVVDDYIGHDIRLRVAQQNSFGFSNAYSNVITILEDRVVAISSYLADAALNHLFGGAALAQPTDWFLALYTSATDDLEGGVEVSAADYSRTSNTGWFVSDGTASNTGAVSFGTAAESWGTITHARLYDQLGNPMFHGPLLSEKQIDAGSLMEFSPGDLAFTLD